jgi:hypothetical protein
VALGSRDAWVHLPQLVAGEECLQVGSTRRHLLVPGRIGGRDPSMCRSCEIDLQLPVTAAVPAVACSVVWPACRACLLRGGALIRSHWAVKCVVWPEISAPRCRLAGIARSQWQCPARLGSCSLTVAVVWQLTALASGP